MQAAVPLPMPWASFNKRRITLMAAVSVLLVLFAASPTFALDLVAFTGITGPLTSALTTLAGLTPAIKAFVGVIAFVVALISLAALRNLGPVLFFIGLAVFSAVGLTIAGAIMGAQI